MITAENMMGALLLASGLSPFDTEHIAENRFRVSGELDFTALAEFVNTMVAHNAWLASLSMAGSA